MSQLAFNVDHAIALHDTVEEFQKIVSAMPHEGLDVLRNDLLQDLSLTISDIKQDLFEQVEEVTGSPVQTGGHSAIVSKVEHERVLDLLKRYTGE